MWRVDHMPKGSFVQQTSWHDSKQGADVAAWRLEFAGAKFVLVWFDSATYEGTPA